jgi:hypothetical protein
VCSIFSFLIFCLNPFYFSLIIFFPRLFFFALASFFLFSPVLPAACSNCSLLLVRTRGPVHDPLLPVHAKPACGPLLRRPVPSRPLALAARALSLSIPAAINGEAPVLPVTPPPRRPSPLFLSAYKLDPKPPLTPPTPPQHLSPLYLTLQLAAAAHPK